MEYLQYCLVIPVPPKYSDIVLNLIINGIPSIQNTATSPVRSSVSFKPYYKWNTFNT